MRQKLGALLCLTLGGVLIFSGIDGSAAGSVGGVTPPSGCGLQPTIAANPGTCPTGTIVLTELTNTAANPDASAPAGGWEVTLTSLGPNTCLLPDGEAGDTDPARDKYTKLVDDNGSVSFEDLFVFQDRETDTYCQYSIAETAVDGFAGTFTPAAPYSFTYTPPVVPPTETVTATATETQTQTQTQTVTAPPVTETTTITAPPQTTTITVPVTQTTTITAPPQTTTVTVPVTQTTTITAPVTQTTTVTQPVTQTVTAPGSTTTTVITQTQTRTETATVTAPPSTVTQTVTVTPIETISEVPARVGAPRAKPRISGPSRLAVTLVNVAKAPAGSPQPTVTITKTVTKSASVSPVTTVSSSAPIACGDALRGQYRAQRCPGPITSSTNSASDDPAAASTSPGLANTGTRTPLKPSLYAGGGLCLLGLVLLVGGRRRRPRGRHA